MESSAQFQSVSLWPSCQEHRAGRQVGYWGSRWVLMSDTQAEGSEKVTWSSMDFWSLKVHPQWHTLPPKFHTSYFFLNSSQAGNQHSNVGTYEGHSHSNYHTPLCGVFLCFFPPPCFKHPLWLNQKLVALTSLTGQWAFLSSLVPAGMTAMPGASLHGCVLINQAFLATELLPALYCFQFKIYRYIDMHVSNIYMNDKYLPSSCWLLCRRKIIFKWY